MPTIARKLLAEGLGTALLVAVVVGSGIMAERLAGGAHFNPAVSLVLWPGAPPCRAACWRPT